MKESTIEKEICNYAKVMGWYGYKFSSPNMKGVPDRIFLREGVLIFIEFKAPGKKPTKLQEKRFSEIRAQGFIVLVVDDINKGVRIFNEMGVYE